MAGLIKIGITTQKVALLQVAVNGFFSFSPRRREGSRARILRARSLFYAC